jgi:plasmid stability protein
MKNVTVTLDEETARWARIEAARQDMSVSSYLRELLRDRMVGEVAYSTSMERYLSRRGKKLGGNLPTREEVHDRAGLR